MLDPNLEEDYGQDGGRPDTPGQTHRLVQKLGLLRRGHHPRVWLVSSSSIDEHTGISHDIGARTKRVSKNRCKRNLTHNRLLSATIISLLEDKRIEIIEIEFPLKCELVVGVEDVKCERRLRSLKRCGVPAYTQKLAIVLDPFGTLRARTKLHVDVVNPVDVNHKDGLRFRVQ